MHCEVRRLIRFGLIFSPPYPLARPFTRRRALATWLVTQDHSYAAGAHHPPDDGETGESIHRAGPERGLSWVTGLDLDNSYTTRVPLRQGDRHFPYGLS